MLSARELHLRGLEANNAGRHALAKGLLGRALHRDGDADTRARVLVSLAYAEGELGGRDAGLRRCDEAIELSGVSDPVRGLVHSQRGLLLMRAGAGREALEAFSQAERHLGNDPVPRVRVHLNRGNVHLQQGETRRAAADFEKAAQWAERAGAPVQRAKAEHNLGYTYLLSGDLVRALQLMEHASTELEGLSPFMRAVGKVDRAEVLVASGMTTDATVALREAASSFGAVRIRQSQGEAELVLARVLLGTDPREAGRVARRALTRFERRGSRGWALRAEAVVLSAELESAASPGATTDARPPVPVGRAVSRAESLARRLGDHDLERESSEIHLRLGHVLALRGDPASARGHVDAAHVSLTSALPLRLLDRQVRAELALARGRRQDGVKQLRRGLDDLHRWTSSFGSLDLRSSVVGHGRALAVAGLSQAVEDGRPDVVFEWAERARALASRVAPVRPPGDAAAAAKLTELRQVQVELADAESNGLPTSGLARRAAALGDLIRQRAWYDRGSGVVVEPVGLDDLRAELSSAGGVLLSYLVAAGQVHVLVAWSDGCAVRQLGPLEQIDTALRGMQADLDISAAAVAPPLREVVHAALAHRLADLDKLLLQPVADLLGHRPLVVVPTGALAAVPWSLLPRLVGRPVTVARSASSWLLAGRRLPETRVAGFVAGPRVDRAVEEVTTSAERWSSTETLIGDEARSDLVSALAGSVDVLHIAAHGRHSADNPLFSGLELADGPWFGYDIDHLDAIPATVVLSACELGRSSVRWGEEAVGMAAAWLHAGARCVIASPASVNDSAACELLTATHERLAAGAAPAEALASAVRGVQSPAPTPFMCLGAGW